MIQNDEKIPSDEAMIPDKFLNKKFQINPQIREPYPVTNFFIRYFHPGCIQPFFRQHNQTNKYGSSSMNSPIS